MKKSMMTLFLGCLVAVGVFSVCESVALRSLEEPDYVLAESKEPIGDVIRAREELRARKTTAGAATVIEEPEKAPIRGHLPKEEDVVTEDETMAVVGAVKAEPGTGVENSAEAPSAPATTNNSEKEKGGEEWSNIPDDSDGDGKSDFPRIDPDAYDAFWNEIAEEQQKDAAKRAMEEQKQKEQEGEQTEEETEEEEVSVSENSI